MVAAAAPIAARRNCVYLGASVRSGVARVIAVEIGPHTEFGAIAARLRSRPPETDFNRDVRQFGYLLMRVMVIVVLCVLTVNVAQGRSLVESLLFAVALAVGLAPELLPAVISVTLSAGARSMARWGVVVRRLETIESLGSMNVVCTDKTGTLTEGSTVLHQTLDGTGAPSDAVRQLAFLNAAFETSIANPLDAALDAAGLGTEGWTKIDEIPYDFARRMGFDTRAMLTGDEIAAMCDEALWHRAPRADLFVEIDPQHKERIVRALQRTGNAVGYMRDGINDAPVLHAADVGISVAEAADVARESADIVLTSRDLGVLCAGVARGRQTFANTLKYIAITTSANFGNLVGMVLATPFLPFLPLAAKQILLSNCLSDLPAIALPNDSIDPERLLRPQGWKPGEIRRFMIVFGLISSVFDLLTFAVLLRVFHAGEAGFRTTWFMISLLTELAVVLLLRTGRPVQRSRPGRVLLVSTLLVALLTLTLPFLRLSRVLFGFVPLTPGETGAVAAIVLGYILTAEATKAWYFRTRPEGGGAAGEPPAGGVTGHG